MPALSAKDLYLMFRFCFFHYRLQSLVVQNFQEKCVIQLLNATVSLTAEYSDQQSLAQYNRVNDTRFLKPTAPLLLAPLLQLSENSCKSQNYHRCCHRDNTHILTQSICPLSSLVFNLLLCQCLIRHILNQVGQQEKTMLCKTMKMDKFLRGGGASFKYEPWQQVTTSVSARY